MRSFPGQINQENPGRTGVQPGKVHSNVKICSQCTDFCCSPPGVPQCLQAAQGSGMQAVLFKGAAGLEAQLRERGVCV